MSGLASEGWPLSSLSPEPRTALWPAPRGRMDDWSVSARDPAAASGEATNLTKSVTLTQARTSWMTGHDRRGDDGVTR
jgi:hypothetical protein